MKVLVHFKHKSMKEYWGGKNYTHNKFEIDIEKDAELEDVERIAEFKIMDITDVLYPEKDGAGFGVLYQYEITKIDRNPYGREWSK